MDKTTCDWSMTDADKNEEIFYNQVISENYEKYHYNDYLFLKKVSTHHHHLCRLVLRSNVKA